jgi:hypothetical protein
MEDVKLWLSLQTADFSDTDKQNSFSDMKIASIPAMNTSIISLSLYVFFCT